MTTSSTGAVVGDEEARTTSASKPVSAAAGIASLVPSKGAPVASSRPSLKPGEYPPTAELQVCEETIGTSRTFGRFRGNHSETLFAVHAGNVRELRSNGTNTSRFHRSSRHVVSRNYSDWCDQTICPLHPLSCVLLMCPSCGAITFISTAIGRKNSF